MGQGIFQPSVWEWLFGPGIGTNLGASLVWVFIAGVATAFLYPPLRAWIERESHFVRAHLEHQTQIAQDHFEDATGRRHPLHGALDHLSKGDKP